MKLNVTIWNLKNEKQIPVCDQFKKLIIITNE